MLRLSLCLIVKDEAELLPRFLEQARGLWDELVAVDTGSSDDTPRLLAEAGARLLHRPWTGDFAAARNHGLDAATGDWIAVLDPDELVSPELVAEVRALLQDPQAGAATVRMVNRLPHGHVRDARLLRLFRSDPAVRFRHAIHEDVSEAVLAHLARTGRRLVHLEGAIDHLGYVRSRAAARDKKARDVTILEACLARDPLDLYAHLKRLEQARFWGDRALWARAAADARRALDRAPRALAQSPHGGELVALMADGLARQPGEALALLERYGAQAVPSAPLLLRRGELLERVGQEERARADFERCLGLAHHTPHRQLATVRPLLGLARLALAAGRLPEALGRVEQALGQAPRDPEALLAALALHRAGGGAVAAAAFAAAHGARHGTSTELSAAVGEERLRAGDAAGALAPLAQAAGTPPHGAAARLLALARLAAGDVAGARALALALLPEAPEAGLVALLCDLCEGKDSALELELEPDEAERSLREAAGLLRAAAGPPVLAALRAAAPALEGLFPWLPGSLA
ncbi:MAG: glycosyltransferase family 2 protein [Anaeromyxobacter sp.]